VSGALDFTMIQMGEAACKQQELSSFDQRCRSNLQKTGPGHMNLMHAFAMLSSMEYLSKLNKR
jgi:hypothetical protein